MTVKLDGASLLLVLQLFAWPWIVRAAPCQDGMPTRNPDDAYLDMGDGSVLDPRSGLVWKRCLLGQSFDGRACIGPERAFDWLGALSAAKSEPRTSAGEGWRLPTIRELRTLVDPCRSAPAINSSIFSGYGGAYGRVTDVWSSSPGARKVSGRASAWYVDFTWGYAFLTAREVDFLHEFDPNAVHLVRSYSSAKGPLRRLGADPRYADLVVSNLPAMSGPRFAGTPLIRPVSVSAIRGQDPSPDSPFDSLDTGVLWMPIELPATDAGAMQEFMLRVEVTSTTSQEIALFVGEDANENGPELSEKRCSASGSGAGTLCEFRIRRAPGAPAAVWWALAQNLRGGSADRLELKSAVVPLRQTSSSLVVTGPGHWGAGESISYRVSWDDPQWLPGEERVGYVLVKSAQGDLVYYEPLWLKREGTTSTARLLRPGVAQTLKLAPGEAQERLYVDVPANATAVSFTSTGIGQVALYAAHVSNPQAPTIEAAPARGAAQHQSTQPGASQTINLSGSQVRPGRWYLTPVNTGTTAADVSIKASVTARSARPLLRPGHYYNPQRSGQGVFLDFAGDQWVLVWYAYMQDGTPTWYYAQNPAPVGDEAQWSSPLYRVVWNGNATHATVVGQMVLTLLPGDVQASPKLTMSYSLDGESGWEPLTRLGDDSCPSYSGQGLDATGHWYSPARSGFGYSAQFLPNTEVHAAYIYDGQGFPRWLYGQKDYNAGAVSVQLLQLAGFCPTCTAKPLDSKVVGTLTRLLSGSSNNDGKPGLSHMEVNATLAPPLQGSWQQSLPVFLLSQRKGCN